MPKKACQIKSIVHVNGNLVVQLGKDNQLDMVVAGATGNSGTTLSIATISPAPPGNTW